LVRNRQKAGWSLTGVTRLTMSSVKTSASIKTAPGIFPASRAQMVDFPAPDGPATTRSGVPDVGAFVAALRTTQQRAVRRDLD
jgi:hypothetical protein